MVVGRISCKENKIYFIGFWSIWNWRFKSIFFINYMKYVKILFYSCFICYGENVFYIRKVVLCDLKFVSEEIV